MRVNSSNISNGSAEGEEEREGEANDLGDMPWQHPFGSEVTGE